MRILPPSESIPKDFSFRSGKNEDSDQIIQLVYTVLEEYDLIPEPSGVDKDLSQVEKSYNDGYFGVIEYKSKIVATYGLYPLSTNAVEIRKMYAYSDFRGKGLGKWMVNHLIEIAKLNGFKVIELETASVLKEALVLYKKMGFLEKEFENKTPRCDKSFHLNI